MNTSQMSHLVPTRAERFRGGDAVDVAIVGAGAAATLLVTALKQHQPGAAVAVVGTGHIPGRGVAYSTTDAQHRMNVPVRGLSVDADGSDHLPRWLAAHGHPAESGTYLPRATYGAYLADQLAGSGADVVDGLVVAITADGTTMWRVELADGRAIIARQVVLATGPPPGPGPLDLPEHPRVLADPWAPDLAARAADAGRVVVLGSGLTMVDVALTATAAGATVEAISRHGWLPTAHPEPRATPRAPFPIPAAPLTAEQLRQLVVDRALAEPAGWAAGMDAARDHANELWALLPADEQAKVLRQMLTAWTIHRHRMSPPVAARLAVLQAANRVRVHSGTVTAVRVIGDEVELSGHRGERWTGGLLVACTGPSADIGRTTDPLLRHLIGTGLAVVGPHRLGLAVDPRGQLVGPDGGARPGLFALGLLRRGTVFETTAIPEIRAQAVALAPLLATAACTPVPGR